MSQRATAENTIQNLNDLMTPYGGTRDSGNGSNSTSTTSSSRSTEEDSAGNSSRQQQQGVPMIAANSSSSSGNGSSGAGAVAGVGRCRIPVVLCGDFNTTPTSSTCQVRYMCNTQALGFRVLVLGFTV